MEIKISEEYLRSFRFGFKLISLLFLLAAPIWLGFSLFELREKMSESFIFSAPPMEIIGVWPDITQAEQEKAREKSRAIFGVTQNSTNKKLYVVTNRSRIKPSENIEVAETLEKAVASYAYPDALSNLPSSFEKVPYYYRTVTYRKYNALGTIFNVAASLLILIFCLALYFPLIKAILNLFRKRRKIAEQPPKQDSSNLELQREADHG